MCFSNDLIDEITNKMQDVRNPVAAMSTLLRELDLEAEFDTPDTVLSHTGEITLSHTHTYTNHQYLTSLFLTHTLLFILSHDRCFLVTGGGA